MAEREGLKVVQMFDAISEKRMRALWVRATNPAVFLPKRIMRALRWARSTSSPHIALVGLSTGHCARMLGK